MILATDYIMKDLKAKSPKMAIFYQNDEYGKEVKWGAMEACKHYGLQIITEETYTRGAVDFSSQVLNLKRANPDYVYLATVMRETPIVLKEAKKLGWAPVFIGNSGYCNDTIIELSTRDTPDILKKMLQVHYIAAFFEENPEMAQLKAAFKKLRPDIDATKHIHFHTLGWINGLIFCEALKRAGRDLTREGFIKAMESMSNFNTGGLAGVIDFGPNRHFADTSGRVFKADLDKKTWVPITNWRKPSFQPSAH
jgi:branched-chain amino acid transport system substrate-binding protein